MRWQIFHSLYLHNDFLITVLMWTKWNYHKGRVSAKMCLLWPITTHTHNQMSQSCHEKTDLRREICSRTNCFKSFDLAENITCKNIQLDGLRNANMLWSAARASWRSMNLLSCTFDIFLPSIISLVDLASSGWLRCFLCCLIVERQSALSQKQLRGFEWKFVTVLFPQGSLTTQSC